MSTGNRTGGTARRLDLLKAFREDVWGNDLIFKEKLTRRAGSQLRTVEYLNFGEHLAAVQSFCKSVKDERILLVKEYYDAMKAFESDDERDYENGACIIGQPGIGKSTFIAYAVVERLRKRHPVAVQVSWDTSKTQYLLFLDHDVQLHSGIDIDPLADRPGIWAFSDSDDDVGIPMVAFKNTPGVRTFQTTVPEVKRWKEWTKQADVTLYVMDLWSAEEIGDLGFLAGHGAERMQNLAVKWGPVSRRLLRICAEPRYEERLETSVSRTIHEAAQDPQGALKAITSLNNALNPGSSDVFFIRPLEKNGIVDRGIHSVHPPTPWLTCKLADALMEQEDSVKIKFFNAMCGQPYTRRMAGWIFEQFIHRFLVHGEPFTVHWYLPVGCPGAEDTEILILPSALKTYHALTDLESDPPFYWSPATTGTNSDSGFDGIDGVVVTETCVYVIQLTIKRERDPSESRPNLQDAVDHLWNAMPSDKKRLEWKFLFVGAVEAQTRGISAPYSRTLTVQIVGCDHRESVTGKHVTRGWMERTRLQVGWVCVRPGKLDFKYVDLVPSLGARGEAASGRLHEVMDTY